MDEILEKLCVRGGCRVVHERPFREPGFKDTLCDMASPGEADIASIPMSSMSYEKRGKRIQEVGFAIDRRLHPQSNFSFANGNRGKANAPRDWVRSKERVELKSCAITFNRPHKRWRCQFSWIKPALFDELWLAIYTFVGIYFYRSKCCKQPWL